MLTGETWRLGHRPALDGLRGIALLLVLVTHAGVDGGTAGGIGVAMFFALSGFLITSLLLGEYADTGRLWLAGFWVRRFARLAPALVVTVALSVALELVFRGEIASPGMVAGALTWTSNYAAILTGQHDWTLLGHTWSLAVEEQFYVLWPLAFLGLVRLPQRWALGLLAAAVFVGALVTASMPGAFEGMRFYKGLDVRAAGLLIGCLFAWWLHARRRPNFRAPGWLPWAGLAVIAWTVLDSPGAWFEWQWAPNVVAAATVAVICGAVTPGTAACRALSWPPLRAIGIRSYGLYLYHPAMLFLAAQTGLPHPVAIPLGAAAAWLVADASLRRVENPIRRNIRTRPEAHQEARKNPAEAT